LGHKWLTRPVVPDHRLALALFWETLNSRHPQSWTRATEQWQRGEGAQPCWVNAELCDIAGDSPASSCHLGLLQPNVCEALRSSFTKVLQTGKRPSTIEEQQPSACFRSLLLSFLVGTTSHQAGASTLLSSLPLRKRPSPHVSVVGKKTHAHTCTPLLCYTYPPLPLNT
jgi:hypothetical protein